MSNGNGVKKGVARLGPEHSQAIRDGSKALATVVEAAETEGKFKIATHARKSQLRLDDLAMLLAEELQEHQDEAAREHLLLQVGEHGVIKPDVRDAIGRFAKEGVQPSGFLRAVLCNDLADTVVRADAHNLRTLPQIIDYVKAYVPSDAWGDKERVVRWRERARLAIPATTE